MQLRISTEVPMMSNHMSKPSLSSCLEQSITSPVEFDAGCLDIEQMIKGPAPEIDADLCIDSDFAIVPDLPVISDFTSVPEIDVKVNSNAMSLETLSNAGSVAMSVDSGCETSALSVDMNLTPSETSSPYDRGETLSPSCSEYSDCSSSSLPMDLFLRKVTMSDDAITLAQHGYSYLTDICPTLQGTLLKAEICRSTETNSHAEVGSLVAIKRSEKALVNEGVTIDDCQDEESDIEELHEMNEFEDFDDFEAMEDDEETRIIVDENPIKEACILKHLSFYNQCKGDAIAKFVEFFEDESYYYTVMEYVDGITLEYFLEKAQEFLSEGKLSRKNYVATVKYIVWQLVATLRWMHEAHQCVHLDLCMSNIMLVTADDRDIFEFTKDGKVEINSNLSIKLVDFGVAEVYPYGTESFSCDKRCLSLDQYQNRCPNQLEEQTYDAKAHDMWCVGHILFELMTGTKLYSVEDTFMKEGGLEALLEGDLKSYLREVGLLNCFKTRPFAVLQGLLAVDENKRFTAAQVTEHPWFSNYHRRYNKSMEMRINTDALKWQNAAEDLLENFPFYPQKF